MTKKDYIVLVKWLRECYNEDRPISCWAVMRLCHALKSDNIKFNQKTFLQEYQKND